MDCSLIVERESWFHPRFLGPRIVTLGAGANPAGPVEDIMAYEKPRDFPDVLNPEETLIAAKELIKNKDPITRSICYWFISYENDLKQIVERLEKANKLIEECLP